ncbi:MAG: lytic murein transglycosylase B [Lysobacteraceae bacterium]
MLPRLLSSGLALLLAAAPALAEEARDAFIRDTAQRHGVDAETVEQLLGEARYQQSIINAISRPAEARPWSDYRPIFLTAERIRDGRAFLAEHETALRRIEAETGVPAEMVVSIIGVETFYGRVKGSFRVLDALYTLGFHYPPRQDFFRSELGHLFALVEEQGLDIREIRGSYAGAMGWGQFIPSSYRAYARDGDGDGRIDLFGSLPDVFASVANYFAEHGWREGGPIAVRARTGERSAGFTPESYRPDYTVEALAAHDIEPVEAVDPQTPASIVRLQGAQGEETWMVFPNFWVITRYNRSPLYAMAVMQLAEEIAAGSN